MNGLSCSSMIQTVDKYSGEVITTQHGIYNNSVQRKNLEALSTKNLILCMEDFEDYLKCGRPNKMEWDAGVWMDSMYSMIAYFGDEYNIQGGICFERMKFNESTGLSFSLYTNDKLTDLDFSEKITDKDEYCTVTKNISEIPGNFNDLAASIRNLKEA